MEPVCRTCLRIIGSGQTVTYLNKQNEDLDSITVRQKLEACVPELTVDIVLEPIICSVCIASLTLAYQFRNTCVETEKSIFRFMQRRNRSTNCTDLLHTYDLLQLVRTDINEEHNYSLIEKRIDTVTDSDSQEEFSQKLPTAVRSSLRAFVKGAAKKTSSSPEKASPAAAKSPEVTVKTKRNFRRMKRRGRKKAPKPTIAEKPSPKKVEKAKAPKDDSKLKARNSVKEELQVPKTRKNEAKSPRGDKKRNEAKEDKGSKTKSSLTSPTRTKGRTEDKKKSKDADASPKQVQYQFLEKMELFSDVSSPSSIKKQVQKIIGTLEESSIPELKGSDDFKINPISTSTPQLPIESIVKRKQRKQARPKKKVIQEGNQEDDVPQIVSYPRLTKIPHKFNALVKQQTIVEPRNGNETVPKKRVAENSPREDAQSRKTIKNEKSEAIEFPSQASDDGNTSDHHNNFESANNDENWEVPSPVVRKSPKKDAPVLTNVDSNSKIVEYDIPVIPEMVAIKSDVDESLNPIWYTTDTKRYQCTKCSKGYNYKCHFDVHLKSHIFKKLYLCPICDKSFTQEKYLKNHALTHAQTEHYQCDVCYKCLSASTALKRHMRTHTGEKPYPCSVCKKRFAQKIQLAVHMRTHTGFRPFVCNTCSAAFTQKSHLMGHVRTHTGEKPFMCDICPKRFRKPYALQIHKESHSQKPYQCKGCNILFRERGTYVRHINKQLRNCVMGRASLRTNKPRSNKRRALDELEREMKAIKMTGNILTPQEDFRKAHLFYCSTCNRGFSTKFSRDRHMRVHTVVE